MTINELAEKVTEVYFDFDPYNGADFGDVMPVIEEGLMSVEGCHNIISELVDMLKEAIA